MDVTLNCALGIPDNEEEVVEDEVKKEAKPVMVEQMVNPNVFGGGIKGMLGLLLNWLMEKCSFFFSLLIRLKSLAW